MVGVRVRFEHRADLDAELLGLRQHRVRRFNRRFAAAVIEIEHPIDHDAVLARSVPDQIAHGVGRLVEKAADFGLGGHGSRSVDVGADYISTADQAHRFDMAPATLAAASANVSLLPL